MWQCLFEIYFRLWQQLQLEWGRFFGIQERLNSLEPRATLADADLEKNTEFRIKWPRGEMGALPADQQQDMLI